MEKLQRYIAYLEQDKTTLNLWLSISDDYRELNDGEKAQYYLDGAKALSGQPLSTKQGLLYLSTHQMILAEEAFRMALEEEDTPANRYNLSFCLYSQDPERRLGYKPQHSHDVREALEILGYTQQPQELPESNLLRAKILHDLQRVDEAITCLEHYIAYNPTHAEAIGLLALFYFDHHDASTAARLANQALSLNSTQYYAKMVRILLKTLKNEVTVEEIGMLLAVKPTEGRLLFALGSTHLRLMNHAAAEQAFFETSQLWPMFYDNWISYGYSLLLQHKFDEALAAYQQAIMIDPNHPDGLQGIELASALKLEDI